MCVFASLFSVEELSSRYKWMCLKRILLEYGISDFSVYPSVRYSFVVFLLCVSGLAEALHNWSSQT